MSILPQSGWSEHSHLDPTVNILRNAWGYRVSADQTLMLYLFAPSLPDDPNPLLRSWDVHLDAHYPVRSTREALFRQTFETEADARTYCAWLRANIDEFLMMEAL